MASVAAPVAAQEIEEVIVTATKREESIQDVPLAINAFTGDFVKDVNLDDVKDLVTFSPGVTGNSTDAFIDGISVRGVRTQDFGVGGDPSAAFFKNNLYEGRNGAVVTSLYDLERAEVLRGPQNFLFGRNAIGGAFSVHTKRPNLSGATDGYAELDMGQRNRVTFEGGATAGITDNFAMRFAAYHSTEDGYVPNVFDGRDYLGHQKTAARISGLWSNDRLEVLATAEYEDMDRDGSAYRVDERDPRWELVWQPILGSVSMPADPRGINSDLTWGSEDDAEILTLGLHVEYDFDNMALSWSTGFKDHDYIYKEDYDATPRNLGTYWQDQTGDYQQSELRLTSTGDGPLSWYAGVSMYQEKLDYHVLSSLEEEGVCAYYGYYYGVDNCSDYFDYWQYYYDYLSYYYGYPYVTVGPFVPTANGFMDEHTYINGKFTGWAAYVDLNYAINDQLDISVGLRHSYDKKRFYTRTPRPDSALQSYFLPGYMTTGLSDTNDWSKTTPRVAIRWMPSDTATFFLSYTEGYKSGGFGTFSIIDSDGEPVFLWFGDGNDEELTQADGYRPAQFRPEEVKSYEVGYKGLLADGAIAWDLTGFYYDYTDLQVNYYDQGAKVGNAGDVEGRGVETTVQWAINENWDLVVSAGWLETEAYGLQFLCGGAPDEDGLLDGDPDACEGSDLHWAPEFMGSAVLKASFPVGNGRIMGNLETFWESERGGGYEDLEFAKLDAYQEWAVRFGYESDNNWSITGYVENVTDELTYAGAQVNGGVTPNWFVGPNKPRTYGIRFGYFVD